MGWDEALGSAPEQAGSATMPLGGRYLPVRNRPARQPRARRASGRRRGIQGLRGIAVVAVVVNHLTGHPQGGFVGVDVFFVISGYLITALLLREDLNSGTISLRGFYARRVRRLFPAALTVTGATIIAAHFVFAAQRYHQTLTDGLWATLFAANWRSIQTGTDYFQSLSPVSPLQHYWSLSIEEQFYLVWPLVLLLVLKAARVLFSGKQHATLAAGTTAALTLAVGSLIVAWQQSSNNAVVGYFSTFTRGWELGLGAILAVVAPYMRGNRRILTALSWLGLAVIGLSLFFVNSRHFPFPGALMPCMGSAAVVIAHSHRAAVANLVLTNRAAVYLGDISYSIYVVHFPVIILAGALITSRSISFYLATTALLLGLSMMLFHLIEDPIRESDWLKPREVRRSRDAPARGHRRRAAMAGAMLVVVSLLAYVLASPAVDTRYQDIAQAGTQPGASTDTGGASLSAGPKVRALDKRIRDALLATSWPTLNPRLDEKVAGTAESAGCGKKLQPPVRCSWGDPSVKHAIYLVGDSTSHAYADAFIELVRGLPGWRVRSAGGSGCAFADQILNDAEGNQFAARCSQRNREIVSEIRAVRPDLLVVTNVLGNVDYVTSVSHELGLVKNDVGTVVVLPAPPLGDDPAQCYTRVSTPVDCVSQVSEDYRGQLANESALARRLGASFLDPTPWFCVNGYCPIFVGTVPMRRDKPHITPQYARYLAPVVLEAFRRAKLLP